MRLSLWFLGHFYSAGLWFWKLPIRMKQDFIVYLCWYNLVCASVSTRIGSEWRWMEKSKIVTELQMYHFHSNELYLWQWPDHKLLDLHTHSQPHVKALGKTNQMWEKTLSLTQKCLLVNILHVWQNLKSATTKAWDKYASGVLSQ